MNRYYSRMINRLLQNIPLKRKLLISYALLLLLPLVTISFFSYDKIISVIKDRTFYSVEKSFNQTYSYLSYKLQKIVRLSDMIAVDAEINEIFRKSGGQYPLIEQVEDMNYLVTYLSFYADSEDILKARFYVKDGLIYSNESRNLYNLEEIKDTGWYKLLMSKNDKVLGLPNEDFAELESNETEIISIARKIRNDTNYRDILGVLRLDIEKQNIDTILSSANVIEESYSYLQNSDGDIIASSVLSTSLQQVDFKELQETINYEEALVQTVINEVPVYYKAQYFPQMDWTMVTVIPKKYITSEVNQIRNQLLISIAILATIAYLFAYYISVSITIRVSRMVSRMKQVQEGDLDSIMPNGSKDEIGELIDNYNFMLRRIKALIQEQYLIGQELKSAELKALQSQINPHFLYNTLDLINWLSQKGKTEEVSFVTLSLANFYRFSLNKGEDISTIDHEIKHVQAYIDIQNSRFRNKIHLRTELDEKTLSCMIPKITLQPIVENAILHGILEKREKEGTITIRSKFERALLVLQIEDDGVGMTQERILQISDTDRKQRNHYAVFNINERFRLLYGEQYRLHFESEVGKGTKVTIRIPPSVHS